VREAAVIAIEVVKKLADQVGFIVSPRRWVVKRFPVWINRNHRLANDFEATVPSAQTLPLRRIRHVAHTTLGEVTMSFESDSQSR